MTAFPWYKLAAPEKSGGVYELRQYTVQPGKVGVATHIQCTHLGV